MSMCFLHKNTLSLCRIDRGFTIIEVMVTMMIISVGILALGKFTGSTIDMDTLAKQRTIAVHVGEELIEEWAATDDLTSFSFTSAPTAGNSTTVTYSPPELNSNVTFTQVATSSAMTGTSPSGTSNTAFTGTPTPIIQAISVSWTHGGTNQSIVLTHATNAP